MPGYPVVLHGYPRCRRMRPLEYGASLEAPFQQHLGECSHQQQRIFRQVRHDDQAQ